MKTQNNLKSAALLAAISLAGLTAAQAQSGITFNLPSLISSGRGQEQILSYYNGGTDQYGDVGPSDGIIFGSSALALAPAPYSAASNVPGGQNLVFFTDSSATMNVPGGFSTGFSFYYTSPVYTGSVNVYSGLDATGTLLATLTLPQAGSTYGDWEPIGVNFSGTAESVDFGGVADYIGFTDITLSTGTPDSSFGSTPTPEPATFALLGLGAVALVARRRK